MSEFKFGDLIDGEEHGLGVVAHGSVYFEDGDIYPQDKASSSFVAVNRHQEWVKCSDSPPPNSDLVMVMFEDGLMAIGSYAEDTLDDWVWAVNSTRMFNNEKCAPLIDDDYQPTHWMPLPEPPKGFP